MSTIVLSEKGAKLMKLCDAQGLKKIDDLLALSVADSVCPAICMTEGCDHIAPMESDHRPPTHLGHAVVVGGGIAGLLAARVLVSHFEQVTLIERDALTDSVQARKGAPQGRMLHAMLPRGQGIVEGLFPGYGHDLKAAGAVSANR